MDFIKVLSTKNWYKNMDFIKVFRTKNLFQNMDFIKGIHFDTNINLTQVKDYNDWAYSTKLVSLGIMGHIEGPPETPHITAS